MFVIGLTGSFASGKTSVAKMFKDLGAKVLDADKIVHTLLADDKPCRRLIARQFGSEIIKKGGVDRKQLAGIVFKNQKHLKKLEAILHPRVRTYIKDEIGRLRKRNARAVIVLEVPLLFEAGFDRLCDTTVVVTARKALQIKRAQARTGLSAKEINQRIKSQMALKEKALLADYIIDNSKNTKKTKRQVMQLWQELFPKTKKGKTKKKT